MNRQAVPEKGGNIAFAIRGARSTDDVAAIEGGFRIDHGRIRCSGPVSFGAGGQLSRSLLTAMKFDPMIRSVAWIRYSDEIFTILSDMFMEVVKQHPSGVSNDNGLVDWDVASCSTDGVPDVIAVIKTGSNPGGVLLFDEEPAGLASNIIILSNRIK
jgi:predicted fused transcriptional regulator/phosphomethylpyrimidine kinase